MAQATVEILILNVIGLKQLPWGSPVYVVLLD